MSSGTPKPSKPRVLTVDDEGDVLTICKMIVADAGMDCVAFADPLEAVAYLKRNERVDVLLADLVMPRMSGLELAEVFKSLQPSGAVVLMTGRQDQLESAVDAGAIPLVKPFSPELLTAILKEALARAAKGGLR